MQINAQLHGTLVIYKLSQIELMGKKILNIRFSVPYVQKIVFNQKWLNPFKAYI